MIVLKVLAINSMGIYGHSSCIYGVYNLMYYTLLSVTKMQGRIKMHPSHTDTIQMFSHTGPSSTHPSLWRSTQEICISLAFYPVFCMVCIHWLLLLCMCSFLWNVTTHDTYFLPMIYINTH